MQTYDFPCGRTGRLFCHTTVSGRDPGILAVCRKENVPYYIVGNGSNLLVGDGGFRGVVLQIFKKMNDVRVEGERVTAQAGVLFVKGGKCSI